MSRVKMKKLRGEFSGIYCLLFDLSGRSLGVLEGTKHGSLRFSYKKKGVG